MARRYAEEMADELAGKPVDRALYRLFAELVGPGALVGDVGCGPGQVSAHLAGLGLRPIGVDPSAGMIEVARERYPDLQFKIGTFDRLPGFEGLSASEGLPSSEGLSASEGLPGFAGLPSSAGLSGSERPGLREHGWAGAVAAYSIIHVEAGDRPAAWRGLARAIRSGGWLLMAFHVEAEGQPTGSVLHLTEWWGSEVDLRFHHLDPAVLVGEAAEAGFELVSRTDREPWPGVEHQSRRCYLLLQRRAT